VYNLSGARTHLKLRNVDNKYKRSKATPNRGLCCLDKNMGPLCPAPQTSSNFLQAAILDLRQLQSVAGPRPASDKWCATWDKSAEVASAAPAGSVRVSSSYVYGPNGPGISTSQMACWPGHCSWQATRALALLSDMSHKGLVQTPGLMGAAVIVVACDPLVRNAENHP